MSNPYFVERTLCPACKSGATTTLYSKDYSDPKIRRYLSEFYSSQGKIELDYLEGASFTVDECMECELVYQREIPNAFLMTKLYDEWIDPERAAVQFRTGENRNVVGVADVDYYSKLALEVARLVAYFNRLPSDLHLLDFGMGWGDWCRTAKAFGCQSYGTDFSSSRTHALSGSEISVVSSEELGELRFDFVNTEQVFEHLAEPYEVLSGLVGSLRQHGLIMISVPDGARVKHVLRELDWMTGSKDEDSINMISPLEHINCFSRKSLIRMAHAVGLKPITLPLGIEYRYTVFGQPGPVMVKNLLRPVVRKFRPVGTKILFARSNDGTLA